MAAPTLREVGGFKIVPVKFNEKSKAGHLMYCKEHSVKESDDIKPSHRTLFVVNVPPYCNKECMERLFGVCGPVESVGLQAKPGKDEDGTLEKIYPMKYTKGFKVAYVVFKHASSLRKALKHHYASPFVLSPEGESSVPTGYKKWCQEYAAMWSDPLKLQKKVDDFMADFDKKKQEEEEQAKEEEGVPDEDGWITVTKRSAKPVVARTERQQRRLQAREKRKRAEKELMNFYTFQTRESKREHIAELRKKFEEDKQRISQMKAARKFKPY
ncbi:ribosomal RNA-processing protein 7 homolog A-like [Diadema setosum]|uniref:ribosomal RNA-processing protein 7 homolog A-like n=1 Tax=Diadema setosum TaxID=31175 RepID=UPI003B3B89DA